MKALDIPNFHARVREAGLVVDPTYVHSVELPIPHAAGLHRGWDMPSAPDVRVFLLTSLLDLMGDWSTCCVWRPNAWWQDNEDASFKEEQNWILSALGVRVGTSDVLEFSRDESANLVAALLTCITHGGNTNDDLALFPDHGRVKLDFSHHDEVYVDFRTKDELERWTSVLATRGFPFLAPPGGGGVTHAPWTKPRTDGSA